MASMLEGMDMKTMVKTAIGAVMVPGGGMWASFRVKNQREPKFAEVGGSPWKFTCFPHILWIFFFCVCGSRYSL